MVRFALAALSILAVAGAAPAHHIESEKDFMDWCNLSLMQSSSKISSSDRMILCVCVGGPAMKYMKAGQSEDMALQLASNECRVKKGIDW